MKEKKKTSNSNNTILRVEKGSLEDKWLSAQSNKTFALKLLIRNAYHQFGNIDLQNVAIDNFLQSPMIDLVKQSRKEDLKEEQTSSDNSNSEKIASSFNHEHKDKADTTKYQQDNDDVLNDYQSGESGVQPNSSDNSNGNEDKVLNESSQEAKKKKKKIITSKGKKSSQRNYSSEVRNALPDVMKGID